MHAFGSKSMLPSDGTANSKCCAFSWQICWKSARCVMLSKLIVWISTAWLSALFKKLRLNSNSLQLFLMPRIQMSVTYLSSRTDFEISSIGEALMMSRLEHRLMWGNKSITLGIQSANPNIRLLLASRRAGSMKIALKKSEHCEIYSIESALMTVTLCAMCEKLNFPISAISRSISSEVTFLAFWAI